MFSIKICNTELYRTVRNTDGFSSRMLICNLRRPETCPLHLQMGQVGIPACP